MRILQVLPTVDPSNGGVTSWVAEVSRRMAQRGHEVTILCADPPDLPQIGQIGLPVVAFKPEKSGRFRYTSQIKPWVQAHSGDFDAAVLHGVFEYPFLAVGSALRGTGTPYLVVPHGMLDAWFHQKVNMKTIKKAAYWHFAQKKVMEGAASWVWTCQAEHDGLDKMFQVPGRHDVLRFAGELVETDREESRQAFRQAFPDLAEEPFILFLGRLDRIKGLDILIDAYHCSGLRDEAKLVLVGPPTDPEYAAQLKSQAERLGLGDRIVFPGPMRGAVKNGAYASAKVFAMTSRFECAGLVVIEAMAMGCPSISSSHYKMHKETTADGAGLLCEATAEGFAEGLRRVVRLPEEAWHNMSEAAYKSYKRQFDIEYSVDDLLAALERRIAEAKEA